MAFLNKPYSFNDLTISMLGNPDVAGVQKLEYKVKQEKENVTGTRGRTVARATGKKEYEGMMTLLMDEANKIRRAANVADLTLVPPFTLAASFQVGNSPIETLVLTGVEFKEDGFSLSESDTNGTVELPIIFSSADWELDN